MNRQSGEDAPLVHDCCLELSQRPRVLQLGRQFDVVCLADKGRVEDAARARSRVDAQRSADNGHEDRVEAREGGVVRLGGGGDRGEVKSAELAGGRACGRARGEGQQMTALDSEGGGGRTGTTGRE